MKTLTGLLPWVAVVGAVAAVIWWLLSRDVAAGRWLLIVFLAGHGAVHLLFLMPGSGNGADWPFDMDRSWAITRAALPPGAVRATGIALVAVTVAGFAVAALCAAGIAVPSAWWRPALAVPSIASVAVLVLFFHPQLTLGLAIDTALIWVAAARAWMP